MTYERKCISCGKEIGVAILLKDGQDDFSIPPCGTVFTAHGNYGSGVFDPMDDWAGASGRHRLEIFMCDDCLRDPKGSVYLVTVKVAAKHKIEAVPFRHGRAVISPEQAAEMECPFPSSDSDL